MELRFQRIFEKYVVTDVRQTFTRRFVRLLNPRKRLARLNEMKSSFVPLRYWREYVLSVSNDLGPISPTTYRAPPNHTYIYIGTRFTGEAGQFKFFLTRRVDMEKKQNVRTYTVF